MQHELSLEDQFSIVSFNSQVDQMSLEQAKDMLKLLYRSYVSQRCSYLMLIKQAWIPEESSSGLD